MSARTVRERRALLGSEPEHARRMRVAAVMPAPEAGAPAESDGYGLARTMGEETVRLSEGIAGPGSWAQFVTDRVRVNGCYGAVAGAMVAEAARCESVQA